MEESQYEIIDSFFSIALDMCTNGYSSTSNYTQQYAIIFNKIKMVFGERLPSWIKNSNTPSIMVSYIVLNSGTGNGSWGRRREFLGKKKLELIDLLNNNDINSIPNATESKEKKHLEKSLQLNSTNALINPFSARSFNLDNRKAMNHTKPNIFIVHGHDDRLKDQVYIFLTQNGFNPVVLHQQPNHGNTIIEKLETNAREAHYAIVLYTPCDFGGARNSNGETKNRARQNVVFEHGYFSGLLGRKNVVMLVDDGVETPGDVSGVVYTSNNSWQYDLLQEIKHWTN